MKKSSFYLLLVTTGILLPAFSLSSWAIDCPDIPEGTKTVTVKDNQATLRKEPKTGQPDPKRPQISKGDILNVIGDNKSTKDEKNCWYKVNPVKNSNADEVWWISGNVGLKEYPFNNDSPANAQTTPPKSPEVSPSDKTKEPNESQKSRSQDTEKPGGSQNWLLWLALALGTFGSTFALLCFSRLRTIQNQISTEIKPSLKDNNNTLNGHNKSILKHQHSITSLLTSNDKRKKELGEISQRVESLERVQTSSSRPAQTYIADTANAVTDVQQSVFSQATSSLPAVKPSLKDEMIEQFNSQNRDYFQDLYFQPLTLTQQSIQGQVTLGARRIVQLVSSDRPQDSYLMTEIDGENWLILNVTSPYFGQLMNNLKENPEIFVVSSASENLQLVKPAKLKNVGLGMWEIEEPGEFK